MIDVDRRCTVRLCPTPGEPISRMRLRTGRELAVLNIAGRGALVEGARLMPGTFLDVHIVTTTGRTLVRSCVLRCQVSQVTADSISYRSGLAFESLIDIAVGYPLPLKEIAQAEAQGSRYPEFAVVRLRRLPPAPAA